MKAKAVRLHGANDLRLDEFELPEIKEDEILVKVVSDSVCMSTYKCAILGVNHKLFMKMWRIIQLLWDMKWQVILLRWVLNIKTNLNLE